MKPLYFSKGIPSNFYPALIEVDSPIRPGKSDVFRANEYYFHCCKVALCNRGTIDMYRDIRDAETPFEAKMLGRQVPLDEEELLLWNTSESLISMLTCNLAKFSQNKKCLAWLRNTGIRQLVEHRPDPIWADNLNGSGMNLLGKTLELVRARLC